ncbi:excisionase family DNA-binding protein [Nocardia sp. CA-120079]|uniref:excisionase family DNA-binding protein n=1 Tax=Nocardia sp. CA-120079 TaxID=3239974 RepID=UPI003D99AF90
MTAIQARLHTIPSACEQLGIGRSYLFELIRDGRLRSVKLGRRRLISEEAIRDFIASAESDSEVA